MLGNSLSSNDVRRIAARNFGTVTTPAQPLPVESRAGEWTCKNKSWSETGGEGE